MKRARDSSAPTQSDSTKELISGAEALRRLRMLAKGSSEAETDWDLHQTRCTHSAGNGDMKLQGVRSTNASEPSTPYLRQRLSNLNGTTSTTAAVASGSSRGDGEWREAAERASFSAQRMRAAALIPSATHTVQSYGTRTNEEEMSATASNRGKKREAPRPIDVGNEEVSLSRSGRDHATVSGRGGSNRVDAPAPIGEDKALNQATHDTVAKAARAAATKPASAFQSRRQAARRGPRKRASNLQTAGMKVPAARVGNGRVVALKDLPPPVTPTKVDGKSKDAVLNSPRHSVGSSSLFDDLATPLRTKAKDVAGFLARAMGCTQHDGNVQGIHPGCSSSHVCTNGAQRADVPFPPHSFASSFRLSTMDAPLSGTTGDLLTLSTMRGVAMRSDQDDGSGTQTLATSTRHRMEASVAPAGGGAGGASVQIPLSRSSQQRLRASAQRPGAAVPPFRSAVSAMRQAARGTSETASPSSATVATVATAAEKAPTRGGLIGGIGVGRLVVVDTSTMLNSDPGVLNLLIEKWTLCVPYTVVDELDNISKGKPGTAGNPRRTRETIASVRHQVGSEWLRHRARELRDWIASALARKDKHVRVQRRTEFVDEYDRTASNNDDAILGFAIYLRSKGERHVMFVTEDKFLRVKAHTELGESYTYNDIKRMIGVRN